ncbi:MAG: KEOPS complex subunit Pcc1 [Halanaeroarchaeum sp.]
MTRTATIRTVVDDPDRIAASIRPDNTASMHTAVERDGDDAAVVTTIERETTGGLRSTVDDYVVNLAVATDVAQIADQRTHTTHE